MANKKNENIDMPDVDKEWLQFKKDYINTPTIASNPMWKKVASLSFLAVTFIAGAAILHKTFFNPEPILSIEKQDTTTSPVNYRFDNAPLIQIMDSICGQYHCSYVMKDLSIGAKHLSFEYSSTDSLTAIIGHLNHFTSLQMSIKDDVIIIEKR